jgi:hypothetical protein
MPRGRLIFPFTVRIAQLDTLAMTEDPDGAGPLTSGYDDDFREPIKVARIDVTESAGDLKGETLRHERTVDLPAQIKPAAFEQLRQMVGGTSPDSSISLTFHFKDLEELGMIDPSGLATIRLNDRLDRVFDGCGIALVFRDPPGLYAVQVQPAGFGLGPHWNLLKVAFEEREQGVVSPAR